MRDGTTLKLQALAGNNAMASRAFSVTLKPRLYSRVRPLTCLCFTSHSTNLWEAPAPSQRTNRCLRYGAGICPMASPRTSM